MVVHALTLSLAISLHVCLCLSTRVLPVGPHSDEPSQAFKQLRDVIVHAHGNYRGELPIRRHIPARPLMPYATSAENAAVAVKRTLLGIRRSCPAGYGYCATSGRCCANSDGGGSCCNDGTCATSSQTCCIYGSRCNNDTKCCQGGCAPLDTECCGPRSHCNPGEYCCGNNVCAPVGGECCRGGGICDAGTICMLYNGYKTCCKDTSCSEFANEGSGSSGNSNGASGSTEGEEASPPELPSSTSIPETTVPSSNPADFTSPAPPTIPSLPGIGGQAADETSITSFTFATITAQSTLGTVLRTFTSTITIYYYTVFITTTTLVRSESSFLSTDFTSAEQEVTAVAADSEAAEAIYRSLRRSLNNEPTLTVSGDGVADFSQTRDLSETTAARSRFTAAEGDGGFSSAAVGRVMKRWEWGMWIWGFVTIAVGVGMVLL